MLREAAHTQGKIAGYSLLGLMKMADEVANAAQQVAKTSLLQRIKANPGKAGLAAGALLGAGYLANKAIEPPSMQVVPSAPIAPMYP